MIRAFLAAVPGAAEAGALEAWAALAEDSPGRAVPADRWHMTLAFFGDVEAARLEEAQSAFRVLEKLPEAGFRCDRWWALPEPGMARVLAVGGEAVTGGLIDTIRALQAALALGGVERRPFLPHVTLRRFGAPFRGEIPAEGPGFDFAVAAVALFESRLGPEGPTYTIRARYRLGGPSQRRK